MGSAIRIPNFSTQVKGLRNKDAYFLKVFAALLITPNNQQLHKGTTSPNTRQHCLVADFKPSDWLWPLPTPSLSSPPPTPLHEAFKAVPEKTHSHISQKPPCWESACSTTRSTRSPLTTPLTCPTTPSRCWSRSPWRRRSTRTVSTASSEWELLCWLLTAVCTQVTGCQTCTNLSGFLGLYFVFKMSRGTDVSKVPTCNLAYFLNYFLYKCLFCVFSK